MYPEPFKISSLQRSPFCKSVSACMKFFTKQPSSAVFINGDFVSNFLLWVGQPFYQTSEFSFRLVLQFIIFLTEVITFNSVRNCVLCEIVASEEFMRSSHCVYRRSKCMLGRDSCFKRITHLMKPSRVLSYWKTVRCTSFCELTLFSLLFKS